MRQPCDDFRMPRNRVFYGGFFCRQAPEADMSRQPVELWKLAKKKSSKLWTHMMMAIMVVVLVVSRFRKNTKRSWSRSKSHGWLLSYFLDKQPWSSCVAFSICEWQKGVVEIQSKWRKDLYT
jgi:hypothetical protein